MKHGLFVAFVLLAVPLVASADSLDVLSGNNQLHPFEIPRNDNTGRAFWNNRSYDGGVAGDCNIGYWLSGLGGCSHLNNQFYEHSPRVQPPFVGDETTRFGVRKDTDATPTAVTVSTSVQATAWVEDDEFGWYLLSDPSTLHRLFYGAAIANNHKTFIPTGDYGFYIRSREGTFFSGGSPGGPSHFAVFQLAANEHYIIGAEDMWVDGDWDYNDLVYDVRFTETPEPATLLLLGAGLGLGAIARRRRTRQPG